LVFDGTLFNAWACSKGTFQRITDGRYRPAHNPNGFQTLPAIIMDEILDRPAFRPADPDCRVSEVDEAGDLHAVRNPENLLHLRLAPDGSGPVYGEACGKPVGMGGQHEVLDGRIDARIADLLALAHPVQVKTTINQHWDFLGIA